MSRMHPYPGFSTRVLRVRLIMNALHSATEFVDRRHLSAYAPGASAAWREVIMRATRVARSDATTCLQGESGTGKEVVARFIHASSPRCRGPFIAINCGALPEQLL